MVATRRRLPNNVDPRAGAAARMRADAAARMGQAANGANPGINPKSVPMTSDGQPAWTAAREEGLFDEQVLTTDELNQQGLDFFTEGRSGRSSAQTNNAVASRLSATQFASIRGMRCYFYIVARGGDAVAALLADVAKIQRGVFVFKKDDQPVLRWPFLKVAGPLIQQIALATAGAGDAFLVVQSGPGYYVPNRGYFVALEGGRNYSVTLEFPSGLAALATDYILKFELMGPRANQAGRGF